MQGVSGCGWLGFAVAKDLSRCGYTVYGSRTTGDGFDEFKSEGIRPFVLKSSDHDLLCQEPGNFGRCPLALLDGLVLSIPPSRRDEPEVYASVIKNILEATNKNARIIFVSTTGVYGDSGRFREQSPTDPVKNTGKAVLLAEQAVMNFSRDPVILRSGGQVGPGRHPGRFLAAKAIDDNPKASVNVVHRRDLVRVVHYFLQNPEYSGIYNVTSGVHPSRKDFYTKAAEHGGYPAPRFTEGQKKNSDRVIVSEKLHRLPGMHFSYNDPIKMFDDPEAFA